MSTCPRCHQIVDSQAVKCPKCHNPLKAFGHPGIPLYQAPQGEFLCDRCVYHDDDSCNYPQRPLAKNCTLFRDRDLAIEETVTYTPDIATKFKYWCLRNRGLIAIAILFLISIVLVIQ